MQAKLTVEFQSHDTTLRGWLYRPNDITTPVSSIIMTHGFSALKEHHLEAYALRFVKEGWCVLIYDNRNFGDSDGEPRLEIDPESQVRDVSDAITFLQNFEFVNKQKIGVWGTSFSAGVMLKAAAADKRIACVVAQVPFVSGQNTVLKEKKPELWEKLNQKYTADRTARSLGKPPLMVAVVSNDSEKACIIKQKDAYAFFTSVARWQNQVTLQSIENVSLFEPINEIDKISPIPLLFIVAKQDTVNSTALAISAFEKALPPKKIKMIEGDHFAPYDEQFEICVQAAIDWFQEYL